MGNWGLWEGGLEADVDQETQALEFPLAVAVAAQPHSNSDWTHPEEAK